MILYFANRKLEILGLAATSLWRGTIVTEDLKEQDVDAGVATFSCKIYFDKESRADLEAKAQAGNYLLRSSGDDKEFYTIIDTEVSTKGGYVYLYAEDAGLELLNEIALEFSADEEQAIEYYVNKYIGGTGFEIGLNEIGSAIKKRLGWTSESTVTERLLDIAEQFGCEISFSFEMSGLQVVRKLVNIHQKRGKELGIQLRLNREIDSIVTKKTVANLATAFLVTGAETDGGFVTNLEGYEYDDGDFYVDGRYLKSRKAVAIWGRYVNGEDVHIVKTFHYDTVSQEELFNQALAELKKACEIEANYEVDITDLPENVKIGDRVDIVDDAGLTYLSARILKLKTSIADKSYKATIGEYLIKGSGISQKVQDLADQFQELAQNRVLYTWIAYADDDQGNGISLDSEGKDYMGVSANHIEKTPDITDPSIYAWSKIKGDQGDPGSSGEDGRSEVSNVTEYYLSTSSTELAGGTWSEQMPEWESGKYIWKRNRITWSDGTVTYTDPILDTALNHANEAADYATEKAEEAATAAGNAQASATIAQEQAELSAQASADAQESANTANTNATDAVNKANAAQEAADEANEQVTIINGEISSIKEDQTDIRNEMSAEITTIKETMEASYAKKTDVSDTEMELRAEISKSAAEIQTTMESDYAKKTELTAVQSSLQTQITQNAQEISSTASAVETVQIDAAEAQSKAEEAVQTATEAQNTAQTAVSAAQDAQESADAATLAAQTAQTEATKAQSEADTAKQAAEDAKAVADAAQTDLDAAKQNLTNVTNRVDATEEEIAAAQAAVDAAQQKADEANASAAEAQAAADEAQASADTAKQNAATAQATADTATANAAAAQTAADEAKAEADKANAAVGNLANTVTDMQTQISQNAEEIELRATKTEVQEYLSGYSTKEETESAINLASASIRAEVNASIGAISGGDNILRGTNVEKELVEDGTWTTGQWKLRGTGTATSYTMTDSPVSSLNIAWTIKGAVYPEKYGGIQQTQITIEPGTYTVSVWAKNTSADSTLSAQLAFYLGNSQIGSTISVGKNWRRYSATFSAETESITIAFYNPSGITSTDICGMTLNKGETASPWTPSTFDIGDDLTAIRASLELKVDKTSLISEINASANIITLTGNRFVVNSDNFSLTQDGTMKATNAEFSGKITSSSGTIGGFAIDADALTYNDDSFYMGLNSYKGIEAYNIVSGAVDNNSRAVLKDGGIYVGSSFGLTTDGTVDWDDYTKHITAVTKDGIFSKKDIVLTENNAGLYGVGAIPSGTIGVAENYHLIGVNADNNVLVGFSATGDAREGNTQIYATNGYVRLIAGNGNAVEEVRLAYNDANGFRFSPTEAGKGLLGSTTYYFNRVYASVAQWTPSDKRKKTNIRKFDERFEKMYDELEPILYELIESRGQSHFGMIAQDVEAVMNKYEIEPSECGFFEYDSENDVYGLVYQELAVYNAWILQKTRQELRELRALI